MNDAPEPDKDQQELQPPVAEKRPYQVESPHGTRDDEYYWMRDDEREDEDMLAYLRAENEYKEAKLAPVADLREALFEEIVARIKQDDDTPPVHDRGYWYYVRYEEGKEYALHARRKGNKDAAAMARELGPEQVYIDENAMAEGHEFFDLGGYDISHDGTLLAYAEDTVGRRQYVLRFRDLASGQMYEDRIENTTGGVVWAKDGKTVFYIEKDPQTLLGVRVRRHLLGTDAAKDPVVYEEQDHSFYMGVGATGDHEYIVIHVSSTVSDEMRYLPADNPTAEPKVFLARERDHEYDADHVDGRWVIRTNWDAKNFRLMQVKDRHVGDRSKWTELVPHREDTFLASYDVFDDYYVLSERSGGLKSLRIRSWKGDKDEVVKPDEEVYTSWIGANPEQDTEWLRYGYTSLVTPATTYEINMKTGERRLLKQQEVLGGFDASQYTTARTWATADDGTKIPVSVVRRKDTPVDGTAPLYQYAYGSYGSSIDPSFRSTILSLLDRGFVFAIAHVRGGQEMGRQWYEDGKLLKKRNTFTDFIDVTEHLVAEKYAAPDKVVANGGSAGGLLMGAIANMRPDLYRVVVADVPFVDVVTTMLDESIPLTTNEFDEWGNPKEKPFYDYMLSYSPYDNVTAQDYPAMLVTSGLWDSQVQYFEPAKWVARLRATKTDQHDLLFHIDMDAGHGGASGRFKRQKERALEFVFILQQLGMASPESTPVRGVG